MPESRKEQGNAKGYGHLPTAGHGPGWEAFTEAGRAHGGGPAGESTL